MIILGTNSIKDTGFNVANSLRFNDDSQDSLQRSPSSASNRRTWTWSGWIKRRNLGADQIIFSGGSANTWIRLLSSDKLEFNIQDNDESTIVTTQLFRDNSASYHIVVAIDTTQGTDTNRIKFYVNGNQVTSFSTSVYVSQNYEAGINNTGAHYIGRLNYAATQWFDGYMSEVCFIDGQQLAPDQFGEFDEDSNIWKPKDVSGLTFGTNGFYLEFKESGTSQNASGLGADTSGNTNHFAVNNLTAIDQSTDTCTNNFATLNPLALRNNPSAYYVTFSDGNLKLVGNDATNNGNAFSTIGFNSGKWYCEVKVLSVEGSLYPIIGVITENSISNGSGNNGIIGQVTSDTVGYANDGEKVIAGTESSYGDTYTDNDIIGIAIDCDNGAVYFSKNGTFQASGNPTSGASKTNAAMTFTAGANYFFGVSAYKSTSDVEFNFGSPPYAISSGNTDGNGYGNFEYAVPSGYYALNTKNLAEYG